MSENCPRIYSDDMVLLNGRRGIAHRQHTAYPFDPNKWLIVFTDGGDGKEWVTFEDVTKLREEFIGMPAEDRFPEEPIALWQTLPHAFDERLTWDATWDKHGICLYCGLKGFARIHTNLDGWACDCPECAEEAARHA